MRKKKHSPLKLWVVAFEKSNEPHNSSSHRHFALHSIHVHVRVDNMSVSRMQNISGVFTKQLLESVAIIIRNCVDEARVTVLGGI